MRPYATVTFAASAATALIAAGCLNDTSEPEADPSELVQSSPSTSEVDGPAPSESPEAEVAVNEAAGDIEFLLEHVPDGEHGVEVSVSFDLQGPLHRNEGNTARAVKEAVDEHLDYDVVVVRAYSASSGDPRIEAWYRPEDISEMDLSAPDESEAFAHCGSCNFIGQNSGT